MFINVRVLRLCSVDWKSSLTKSYVFLCEYVGVGSKEDSIDHTFTDCVFVKKSSQEVISWLRSM